MKSVVEFCEDNGCQSAARTFAEVVQLSDASVAHLPTVPCFDLFPGNVLWRRHRGGVHLTFIDFDKSHRLVPAGEQLSHLYAAPPLRSLLRRAVERYESATGRQKGQIWHVLKFACFFRTLAGIRDSLPRNERAALSLARRSVGARQRVHPGAFWRCKALIPALSDTLGLSERECRSLFRALVTLEGALAFPRIEGEVTNVKWTVGF